MSEAESPSERGLHLDIAGLTDIGRVREHNEDYLGNFAARYAHRLESHGYLFAVADGMGGHALGQLASQVAIDTLFEAYYNAELDPASALLTSIDAANAAVHDLARLHGALIGTTLTVALLHDSTLVVANVGDSRVYRIREGKIQQLTRDHSLIAEQVQRGLLTPEQARMSEYRNVITRSIGARPTVEPDLSESLLQAGDVLVLTSDGLHNLVAPAELTAFSTMLDPAEAARSLVGLANARGGSDNISCLIVRVLAAPPDQALVQDEEPL